MVKKILIEGHLGGCYLEDNEPSYDDLYCDECGDADSILCWIDTNSEDSLVNAASRMNCSYWSLEDYADPISLGRMTGDEYDDPEEDLNTIATNLVELHKMIGKEITADEAMKLVRVRVDALRAERGINPIDHEKSARWFKARVQEKADEEEKRLKEIYDWSVSTGRIAGISYNEYRALRAVCYDWLVNNKRLYDFDVSIDDGWQFNVREDKDIPLMRPVFICPSEWADEYKAARIEQIPWYKEVLESFHRWAGKITSLELVRSADGVPISFRRANEVEPTVVKI